MRWILGALAALPALVSSLASTDSYRDADIPQSGYLPNHNLDPNVVGSSSFRTLWSFESEDSQELWLAKPLTYTPAGSPELLITSSEKNIIRVFDAKTGVILNQRQLQAPFSSRDANCGDVPNWIGVTGTPLIDPATDIMYVFSKGYREGTTSGTENGVYRMYAIRIPSLEDVEGFPALIDGARADNDPARYFVGGVALQRPALSEMHGHIVAGFGSHCGRWNYTGYLVSVSKNPGVGVTSMWATEYAPGAPSPQPLDLATEQGGKAGIWQSGFGLPVTGNSVYFVTGNGQGMHNGNVPASGRSPMSTLSHCTVRMELSPDGKWSQMDYFQPYDYTSLNAGDRDVGSGGFALLDGSVFRGAGINRMGVIAGKEGRAYVLNANDLGGFRQGPSNFDNTVQTIELGGAIFGGFGSYPLEGGYIYATTVGGPLQAYRLGHDANGKPLFSIAGQSEWRSAGRVGVGQMTVTSDNGRPGSAIVWITDVTVGLAAFRAVPENGVMVRIPLPDALRGSNKYQRPVFGDGRVYYQATTNRLFCLGSPVAQAVRCSDIDFGSVELGSVTSATVSCRAEIAVSAVSDCSISNPSFGCDSSSLPQGALAAGSSFTFDVTWDLSDAANVVPGFVSSTLSLDITAPKEYAAVAAVALEGTVTSQKPFLHATSNVIPFGNLILRSDALDHLEATAVLENAGNSTLTIAGVAWLDADGNYHNVTESGELGSGFASGEMLAVGSSIEVGGRTSINLRFEATATGSYETAVTVWSDGGVLTLTLTAAVMNPPIVTFEVSDGEGEWESLEPDFAVPFGDVTAGTSAETQIRVCNKGGSIMTITISKPPVDPQLLATNPSHDLAEGIQVEPDTCSVGNVAVHAHPLQPNHPTQDLRAMWTLTTNGLNATNGEDSGLHNIVFTARVVPAQLGPVLDDGFARYQYVGCFADTTRLGRNLQAQVNTAAQQLTNTIQQCQALCFERGYILSGVQYRRECWCGGPPNYVRNPSTYSDPAENRCTFGCTGDDTQACGGDGGYMSLYADTTAFDIEGFLDSIRNNTEPNPPSSTTTASTTSTTSTVSNPVTSPVTTTTTTTSAITTTSTTAGPIGSSPASPLNPKQPDLVDDTWRYTGCFQDLVDNVRTFSAAQLASDDMDPWRCGKFCENNGSPYNYFGLTYGRECYCGWSLNEDALRAPEADCPNPCVGSTDGLCGGWRKLSVFKNVKPYTPPAGPAHVPQVLDYQWAGCQTEATSGRALGGKTYASDSMTVDSCAAFCAEDNFGFMGVEYGRECYCGHATGTGSVSAPTSECNMLCKGNSLQYCGAGSRLDLYQLVPGSGSPAPSSVVEEPSSIVPSSAIPSSEAPISSDISSAVISSAPVPSASASSEIVPPSEVVSSLPVSSAVASSAPISSIVPSSEPISSAAPSSEIFSSSEIVSSPLPSSIVSSIEAVSSAVSSIDIISSAAPSSEGSSSVAPSSEVAISSAISSIDAVSSSVAPSEVVSSVTSSSEVISSVVASSSEIPSSAISSSEIISSPVPSSEVASSSVAISSSEAVSNTSGPISSAESSVAGGEPSSSVLSSEAASSVFSSVEEHSSVPSSSAISSEASSFMSVPSIPAVISSSTFITTTTSSSTSSGPTATPTNGYYYVGCFQDTSRGHALPHMLSNRSVTPELCLDYAQQRAANAPVPTAAPAYVFIEYHHECYAGNSFDFQGSAVTSLVGTRACKDYCYGSVVTFTTDGTTSVTTKTDNYCGGPKMFDLYATELPVEFPETALPMQTRTTGTPRL